MRTVVVGAGIAGLTAAFRLKQAGHEVRVLEAADHVGGRMVTVRRDGYAIDVGAALLSSKYTQLRALAADVGVADEIIEGSDMLGILRDGEVHRLRSRVPLDAARTRLLSTRAKLGASKILLDAYRAGDRLDWFDLSRAADLDTETVAAYGARRLNAETAQYLVEPIVRTIYLGNVDDVSVVDLLFTVRNFFGGAFMNGAGGIDWLCRGLAAQLDVVHGARVTDVQEHAGSVSVAWSSTGAADRVEQADACVIALSGHAMAGVHRGLSGEARELVGSLRYQDLMSVQIGLDQPTAEPSAALAMPRSEHRDLCAIILDHNKAPDRAPAGRGLIGAYWDPAWVDRHWDKDDLAACAAGLDGVEQVLPEIAGHVTFTSTHRFPHGVLVAEPGTYARLRRFHALYPDGSRIQLAGDYIGGSTTNSALCSGERAAARVRAALEGSAVSQPA
ncbi:MAG: Amine oxidase [Solirubrobacterales bacterium]|nr:Amine oxidase [Solirubrobacterales bacterium]